MDCRDLARYNFNGSEVEEWHNLIAYSFRILLPGLMSFPCLTKKNHPLIMK